MTAISTYTPFIEERRQLIAQTNDPALKQHYQAEIDLVESWNNDASEGSKDSKGIKDSKGSQYSGSSEYSKDSKDIKDSQYSEYSEDSGDIRDPEALPPPYVEHKTSSSNDEKKDDSAPPLNKPTISTKSSSTKYNTTPDGYAKDWHTIRFSNTTDEPITVHVTVASGQSLPDGVDANGDVVIQPGEYVDLTFAPETSANFRSTKGDGSVWNQGEVYFDEKNQVIWGNMSYIYGANSNMRMFSQDGQHAGYQGDLFENAPEDARIGNWGIMAPYDRYHHSDDPNNPDSATGGPDGAKNAGSKYLYSVLDKGEGYVGRGRPAENSDYDDASSLRFTKNVTIVF